jgi:hypothetical protein
VGALANPRPSRRFSAALISIRPDRDGRIRGYSGFDEVERAFGQWTGKVHLPAVGASTAPVGAGYMGHGWMHVRHPDYDELRRMLDVIGQTCHIHAG